MIKEEIEHILTEKFAVTRLHIVDDSAKHAGHKEAQLSGGGHYYLLIVSKDFEGLSLQQRHRMVNNALKDHFKKGIHALSLKALTPTEDASASGS